VSEANPEANHRCEGWTLYGGVESWQGFPREKCCPSHRKASGAKYCGEPVSRQRASVNPRGVWGWVGCFLLLLRPPLPGCYGEPTRWRWRRKSRRGEHRGPVTAADCVAWVGGIRHGENRLWRVERSEPVKGCSVPIGEGSDGGWGYVVEGWAETGLS